MNGLNRRVMAYIGLSLLLVFTIGGLLLGQPSVPGSATFGEMLVAFASDTKTRIILAMIFVDLATGVMAALKIGTFDPQRLAGFLGSNVLPYVLGYLMVWSLTAFGVLSMLPAGVSDVLESVAGGAVLTTLSTSILDNIARLTATTVPTSEDIGYASRPTERHG